MPNTWIALIKFFNLLLSLTVKVVQILLISKKIEDCIPNKITLVTNLVNQLLARDQQKG